MGPLDELLFGVWREAGRHTDIPTSTAHITQLLARCMPVKQVAVQRIDPERSCLETVGLGTDTVAPWTVGERSQCASAHLERLLAWCHRREVALRRRGARQVRDVMATVPLGVDDELLIGPLIGEHGTCGVIILLATPE